MCGIVGYIGPKSIDSVVLVGLKKLEYRGYDSAGIAIMDQNEISTHKEVGKIKALENLISGKKLKGQLGIGHTRWATHGEPSRINAHPHCNKEGTIAVVQNGIIENFLELKQELISDGYIFNSETDTEVIGHLMDYYLKEKFSSEQAFVRTLNRLEGKYAIALITENDPDRIYFAKDGAPLIIAKDQDQGEAFLASDLPALIPLAEEACYLVDGDWGYLSTDGIALFGEKDQPKEIEFTNVELKIEDIDKGDYDHFMLKEIFEQKSMIEKIIESRLNGKDKVHFEEMNISNEILSQQGRIIIQACGTSLNAGLIGKMYLENYSKIYTDADFSSEFRYRNPVAEGDSLVIGISQSGETADTLAGLHEAKSKFLKVLSFINNENSTMARESDACIHLKAGQEIGVASTKAYTAQVMHLFLFAMYMSNIKWNLPREERVELIKEIRTLPEKMERTLSNIEPIKAVANYLKDASDTIFLGRTYNYPTALEGALKLKEISYIHASGYAGGEFKHGPIALLTEAVPVILICPKGEIRTKMISNLLEVKARNAKIITIITEGDEEIKEMSDFYIEVPETIEALSPILTVLPLQLIAYYTALYRGCDVDQPRNLAKSVTVE